MTEITAEASTALTVQFLEWLAAGPRTRDEVMDVWRTSCPRLSIWEDACGAGLVDADDGEPRRFLPSAQGREFIHRHRREYAKA